MSYVTGWNEHKDVPNKYIEAEINKGWEVLSKIIGEAIDKEFPDEIEKEKNGSLFYVEHKLGSSTEHFYVRTGCVLTAFEKVLLELPEGRDGNIGEWKILSSEVRLIE